MKNIIHYTRLVTLCILAAFWLACNKTTVIYPLRKDIIETVYASGKIISGNEYKLSALSNGTVIKKMVKDGDTVKKGQLLYIISNEVAKDRLAAALSNYQVATNNLSGQSPLLNELKLSLQNAAVQCSNDSLTYYRWKNLWEQGIGTKSNLDNVYSNYQLSLNQAKAAKQRYTSMLNDIQIAHSNARSQLTTARKNWNEYFIKSDCDGVVFQTFKEAGETVFTNEVVALLGESGQRVIRLTVDQQDVDKVKSGQQVLLQTDVTGNTIYEARVTRIYPVMNEADQTFRVDAHFVTLPTASFIHSSVEANIIVQKKSNALVLPADVLVSKDSVWIQTKEGERKTGIQRGISTLEYVEIISGINEKTPVLVTPQK